MRISCKILVHGLANVVVATGLMAVVVLTVVYDGSAKQQARVDGAAASFYLDELSEQKDLATIITRDKVGLLIQKDGVPVFDGLDDAREQAEVKALLADPEVQAALAQNSSYVPYPLWHWPLVDSRTVTLLKSPDNPAMLVVLTRAADEVMGVFINLLIAFCALGLGGALLSGVGLYYSVRMSLAPMNQLAQGMAALADGQLHTPVPALGRADEVGEMASAVQVFKENALEREKLEADQQRLRQQAEGERRQSRLQLASQLDEGLHSVIARLETAADDLAGNAGALGQSAQTSARDADAAQQASARSAQSAQSLSQTADQLSDAIAAITRHVEESQRRMSNAVDVADRTGALVNSLQEAASSIGAVVTLITDIAHKTNLLALNATIEAARAGEAGKGFAVVANEVKHLADQTATATKDISRHIAEIRQTSQASVQAITDITSSVRETSAAAVEISAAVEQQSHATRAMADSIRHVVQGSEHVNQNIGSVQGSVDKTSGMAVGLRDLAVVLKGQVDELNSAMTSVLGELRA